MSTEISLERERFAMTMPKHLEEPSEIGSNLKTSAGISNVLPPKVKPSDGKASHGTVGSR
jgi:hypothetical protein